MNQSWALAAVLLIITGMVPSVTFAVNDDAKVLNAIKAGLDDPQNFKTVHDFVVGDTNTAAWRKIPWMTDLWAARLVAMKKKKPIFVWAMNGDPLGCV